MYHVSHYLVKEWSYYHICTNNKTALQCNLIKFPTFDLPLTQVDIMLYTPSTLSSEYLKHYFRSKHYVILQRHISYEAN